MFKDRHSGHRWAAAFRMQTHRKNLGMARALVSWFIAAQVLDIISTWVALQFGGAYELNPVTKIVIGSAGFPGLVADKAIYAAFMFALLQNAPASTMRLGIALASGGAIGFSVSNLAALIHV